MTLESRIYYAVINMGFKDIFSTAIKIATLFSGIDPSTVGFLIIIQIASTLINLLKNLLKMLEVRPSIVTQAQFDELSTMKDKWEDKKKLEEKENLEKILISNNLLYDNNQNYKK